MQEKSDFILPGEDQQENRTNDSYEISIRRNYIGKQGIKNQKGILGDQEETAFVVREIKKLRKENRNKTSNSLKDYFPWRDLKAETRTSISARDASMQIILIQIFESEYVLQNQL